MDKTSRPSVLEAERKFVEELKLEMIWPTELTNITGTRLENINDDCLLEIFSVKSLDLLDMCSIAETCKHFQQITVRIFPKKLAFDKCYGNNDVYIVESEKYYGQQLRKRDVERVITNFGVALSNFSISSRVGRYNRKSLDGFFMNAVERNVFDNLEGLQIRGFKMPGICTDKFEQVCKRLQLLDLHFVSTDDITLYEGFDSLIELKLTQVEGSPAILKNIFPKLERFVYGTCDIELTSHIRNQKTSQPLNILIRFFSRHNALKSIDLCCYSETECLKMLLQAIGNDCKELMELRIRVGLLTYTSLHLQPLRAFRSLRFLELWEVPCGSFPFISDQTELRELHLVGCDLPQEASHFARLAQLTKLVIRDCRTTGDFNLVQVIDRLKNLGELAISALYHELTHFILSKNLFTKIVDTVVDRAQVLTLKCEFNFNLNDLAKSPKIVLVYYIGDDED